MSASPRKAFTLIELLIVITIIGILAVALVPRVVGGPAKARDAQRRTDLQSLATALELYASDNGGRYPSLSSGMAACVDTVTAFETYMTTVPVDPSDQGVGNSGRRCMNNYTYIPLRSGGATNPNGYLLYAKLESSNEGGDDAYVWNYIGSVTNTTDAQANIATMTMCSAGDCSSGAMVVIGR